MVTLGSIQPTTFQAFHGSASYDDALNFRTLELALNDVADMSGTARSTDPAEERAPEPSKPVRRGSIVAPPLSNRSGLEEVPPRSSARHTYTQSSASHRLFRAAEPEVKSWQTHVSANEDSSATASASTLVASGVDSRLRASSWHAADTDRRRSPPALGLPQQQELGLRFGPGSPTRAGRRGREDRPSNEILDGSDVLQQISNLTSTEPSNEREVFVGGLRESEDAVHITEEELATYFAKFGVIESVSINRDDRTQRGRGFAFVKFFQESAALNAVVADASTHVIRGTTVSVQWSRGAKDAGGDRPRRRNSATSATSSGNGSSPPRGSSRSSPKMNVFSSHKGGAHRSGGGGGSCGSGCSRGFSPMRSRSQGHIHSSGGGGVPYGFCGGSGGSGGGGRHVDHLNQPMVCVVVPAQRAAALGLSHHAGHHASGACSSRGSPPHDGHFVPYAQPGAAGGGGGHSSYPSHTRSHSHTPTMSTSPHAGSHSHSPMSASSHVNGGYGHHAPPVAEHHHHAMAPPHHVSPKASRSYGAPPPMQMPPVHHERRGRAEPRVYPSASSAGSGGSSSFSEYERSNYDLSPHSTSYASADWGGDGTSAAAVGGRGMAHSIMRSQSPPAMMRSAHGSRNGGGAPRPPPTPPRGYDSQYSCTRYSSAAGQPGRGGTDGLPPGVGTTGRRHSGSSLMTGRNSMRQEALAATSYYYSVDDIGNEHTYESTYGHMGPSRMA